MYSSIDFSVVALLKNKKKFNENKSFILSHSLFFQKISDVNIYLRKEDIRQNKYIKKS